MIKSAEEPTILEILPFDIEPSNQIKLTGALSFMKVIKDAYYPYICCTIEDK
jgi:hypothetical protein